MADESSSGESPECHDRGREIETLLSAYKKLRSYKELPSRPPSTEPASEVNNQPQTSNDGVEVPSASKPTQGGPSHYGSTTPPDASLLHAQPSTPTGIGEAEERLRSLTRELCLADHKKEPGLTLPPCLGRPESQVRLSVPSGVPIRPRRNSMVISLPGLPGSFPITPETSPTGPDGGHSRGDASSVASGSTDLDSISEPPSEWRGKPHVLQKKLFSRQKELCERNQRWAENPLNPPPGVKPLEWMKRCIAADERETQAHEAKKTDDIRKLLGKTLAAKYRRSSKEWSGSDGRGGGLSDAETVTEVGNPDDDEGWDVDRDEWLTWDDPQANLARLPNLLAKDKKEKERKTKGHRVRKWIGSSNDGFTLGETVVPLSLTSQNLKRATEEATREATTVPSPTKGSLKRAGKETPRKRYST